MRTMMRSKIHRARVTQVDLDYEGSITIDRTLMEASDILPFERVEVLDVNNGEILRAGTPPELSSDPQVRKIYLGEEFSL